MKINFGEILLSELDRRNLTQKDAANMLHITPQALNSYIRNRRIPDMETMRYILQNLQLDANSVLQLKLDRPREYVTENERSLLHLYRDVDYEKQIFIILLLEVIVKSKL